MIIKDVWCYSGEQIHKRFAYRYFRENVSPTGDIVAFIAPMQVTDNLIDLEDALCKDFIHSEKAVNFLWEVPNLCPVGAVAFQRLLNTHIAQRLNQTIKKPIEMRGDDLIVIDEHKQGGVVQPNGKASVSITYSSNGVALGHTGVNIIAGPKAPVFAYSTNMSDAQTIVFMNDVISEFRTLIKDIHIATTKVIV